MSQRLGFWKRTVVWTLVLSIALGPHGAEFSSQAEETSTGSNATSSSSRQDPLQDATLYTITSDSVHSIGAQELRSLASRIDESSTESNVFVSDPGPSRLPEPFMLAQATPVPSQGPFRLLDGEEYLQARATANRVNQNLRRNDPAFKNKDIHEIQPVKFGGSPVSLSNKILLNESQHTRVSISWRNIQRDVEGQ